MFTRKDYLDGKCSHDEYYAQLVEGSNARGLVRDYFGIDVLKNMYEKDEHFNIVPDEKLVTRDPLRCKTFGSVSLNTWDRLGECLIGVDWRKYYDYCSQAGRVCVLKCAARQLVKEA
jgi:hypothetical protein